MSEKSFILQFFTPQSNEIHFWSVRPRKPNCLPLTNKYQWAIFTGLVHYWPSDQWHSIKTWCNDKLTSMMNYLPINISFIRSGDWAQEMNTKLYDCFSPCFKTLNNVVHVILISHSSSVFWDTSFNLWCHLGHKTILGCYFSGAGNGVEPKFRTVKMQMYDSKRQLVSVDTPSIIHEEHVYLRHFSRE